MRDALAQRLGARAWSPVAGGDINDAFRIELEGGGRAFVKTRADAAPGEFAAEADGLRWLGAAGGVAVPAVLSVADDHLALEWVEAAPLDPDAFGRALAVTHAAGATGFGAHSPTRFGALELSNAPALDYATFLAERRLRPLARAARDRGLLDAAPVERVCARLPELLGPAERPARAHGDLWSGNVIGRGPGAAPVVVDPAAHGGHREADLAMLELFGSPSPGFHTAYQEAHPVAPGREERVALHQLAPLLVHAVLFGGGYVARAAAVARRYA